MKKTNLNMPSMSPENTKIVFLGASVRALMQSAKDAGIESIGIDFFADWDTRSMGEIFQVSMEKRDWLTQFQNAIQKVGSTENLYCMYTGGLENDPELIREISSSASLLGCHHESLMLCRDPFLIQKTLIDHGFSENACDVKTLDDEIDRQEQWLIKPFRSAGGQSIIRVNRNTNFEGFDKSKFYLQAFQNGEVYSTVFLAGNNPDVSYRSLKLFGTTKQLISQQEILQNNFLYSGSIGPVNLPEGLQNQIDFIAQLFTEKFDLQGLFGIDYVLTDNGLKVIEINPRYTASAEVLERSSSRSFVGLLLTEFFSKNSHNKETEIDFSTFTGKRILYAESELQVPENWDWSEYQNQLAVTNPSAKLVDLPIPNSRISTGAPICTAIFSSNELNQCEDSLNRFHNQKILEFHNHWNALKE